MATKKSSNKTKKFLIGGNNWHDKKVQELGRSADALGKFLPLMGGLKKGGSVKSKSKKK